MKTRYLMAMLTMGLSVAAVAQDNDDMYFNAKDRAKLNTANEIILAKKYGQEDMVAVRTNPVNPSDTYSGRGVNPEYNAQAKNGTDLVQNEPAYFVPNYAPLNVNQNLYSANSSSYSSPYLGSNGYNSSYGMGGYNGFNSMYSPYSSMGMMGGMYSPYSSMSMMSGMYSPYSSMSMMYGGMYSPYSMMGMSGMSMGMSMGFGSMYGMYSPYSMMGMYGMYGMYSPYSYGYGMYPAGYVVGEGATVSQGRHPSRSSSLTSNYVDRSRTAGYASPGASTSNSTAVRSAAGGRMSTGTSQSSSYYDRGWRNNSSNFTTSGVGANSGSSSWGGSNARGSNGGSGSGWDSGGRRQSVDSWGGGGGSRGGFSSGGGGGFSGGGGGGASHGRH